MPIAHLDIPGLRARPMEMTRADGAFVGALSDLEAITAGSYEASDPDDIVRGFGRIPGIEPEHDIVLVEHDGDAGSATPVAYGIVRTFRESPGPRALRHMIKVHPDWARRGIGTALLDWAVDRLEYHRERVASEDPDGTPIVYRTTIGYDTDGGLAIMKQRGYEPTAYWAEMERPTEGVPEASLPEDVELRPVEDSQLRQIWEADVEAFRDHWGFVEPVETDYQEFLDFPYNDYSLWTVAWHGDEVVGQIRSFVNEEENEKFGLNRGWTEFISTARDWRGRGIAGALISESVKRLAARGLDTACLGVHTDNPNGALQLYERFGYVQTFRSTEFEKPYGST